MSATTMHRRRYRGADPTRRIVGWSVVIAAHLLVLWALTNGNARRGLAPINQPLQAVLIQEVIIPPPPPPPKEIPKPEQKVVKAAAPPPAYVPLPEVQPPVSPSQIAVQSLPTPPVAAPVIAPPPPSAAPASSGSSADMGVACPTQVRPQMPRKAIRDGTEGVVKAQALIRDGLVREVTILSGPRVFHAAVREAMMQYKCVSGSGEAIATQEFVFKID
jgi:protein TonB